MAALIGTDTNSMGIFLNRRCDNLLHRTVVADMNDFAAAFLKQPTKDIDGGIMSIKQGRGCNNAYYRHIRRLTNLGLPLNWHEICYLNGRALQPYVVYHMDPISQNRYLLQFQSEAQLRDRLSGDSQSLAVFLKAISSPKWCKSHSDLCLKAIRAVPHALSTTEGEHFLSILIKSQVIEINELAAIETFRLACVEKNLAAARALLFIGLSPLAKDGQGNTPFHFACETGDVSLVQDMLSSIQKRKWNVVGRFRSNPINMPGAQKKTPLHHACINGDPEVVRLLLQHGASVNAKTSDGHTPLHAACQSGNLQTVRALLHHGANPTSSNQWASTPLKIACREGHSKIVKLLLENDVNPNDKADSKSALHIACERGDITTVKYLLREGADVSAIDLSGNTPLHVACLYHHAALVEPLLKNGAKVKVFNKGGSTPLHMAAKAESPEVIIPMLGKFINIKDRKGNTPLHIAVESNNGETVKAILDAGALCDIHNEDGYTPLHLAATTPHIDIASLLLEKADINAQTKEGDTPLHLAARAKQVEMVEILVKTANVNIQNQTGQTALAIASASSELPIVTLLIQSGANVNLSHPLKVACEANDVKTFTLLAEAGANILELNEKDTLLQLACTTAGPEIVELIVQKSGYASEINAQGNTAYMLALSNHKLAGNAILDTLLQLDDGTSSEALFQKLLVHRFSLKGTLNVGEHTFQREAWDMQLAKAALERSITTHYSQLSQSESPEWEAIYEGLTGKTQRAVIVLGKDGLSKLLTEVKLAIQHSTDPFKDEEIAQQAANIIADGKPLAIITGWPESCVTIAFLGDSICLCHQGREKQSGILCYTIKNKENILLAIKRLAPMTIQHYFNFGIHEQLGLTNEMLIPKKWQKTGNYSVANSNSMEFALLYLLIEREMGHECALELAHAIQHARCEDSKNGSVQEYLKYHSVPRKYEPDINLLEDLYNKKTSDSQSDKERQDMIREFIEKRG